MCLGPSLLMQAKDAQRSRSTQMICLLVLQSLTYPLFSVRLHKVGKPGADEGRAPSFHTRAFDVTARCPSFQPPRSSNWTRYHRRNIQLVLANYKRLPNRRNYWPKLHTSRLILTKTLHIHRKLSKWRTIPHKTTIHRLKLLQVEVQSDIIAICGLTIAISQ